MIYSIAAAAIALAAVYGAWGLTREALMQAEREPPN